MPAGQTPEQTLEREGWEEAGLRPAQLRHARRGRVIRLVRDIPEGLQHEWLHAFDVALPAGVTPVNQDGEVAAFRLLPVHEALTLAAGDAMTVDAALVTLDFALRHALLAGYEHRTLEGPRRDAWVAYGLTPRRAGLSPARHFAGGHGGVAPGATSWRGEVRPRQGLARGISEW